MKLTLLKFGAAWCPPCRDMVKRQTLERFAEKHPEVKVIVHDDTEDGSKAYEKLADRWGIKNIPTLIWMHGGEELFRSSNVGARDIEEQFQRAVKKVEALS